MGTNLSKDIARMCKISEIAGLSAVLFSKESLSYSCTGKVSLVSKEIDPAMIGYIIRDTKLSFIVYCAYVYDDCSDHYHKLFITQYWTIRFKISISGATSFTVNRLVLNDKLNILHTNC